MYNFHPLFFNIGLHLQPFCQNSYLQQVLDFNLPKVTKEGLSLFCYFSERKIKLKEAVIQLRF